MAAPSALRGRVGCSSAGRPGLRSERAGVQEGGRFAGGILLSQGSCVGWRGTGRAVSLCVLGSLNSLLAEPLFV